MELGNLIIVDIQPEYKDAISFSVHEFIATLYTTNWDMIYYLFNGQDTLGMVSEQELKQWIAEESGADYDEVYEFLDGIRFYDKGYAFFRFCIDEGFANEEIVALVKFMNEKM